MADLSKQPHALNCALLIPVVGGAQDGADRRCTCGQLPSANSPEGRKHELACKRIDTELGKYDAELECTCKPLVHDHGPEEGRGLNCPEFEVASGIRKGFCVLTEEERERKGLGLLYRPAPVPARRAETVPPVDSRPWPGLSDEVRTTSVTGGHKGVKPERFDLLPPEALAVVARHYAIGAAKYGEHNWRKGYEWSKAYAAMQRHLHAWLGGEDLDPETQSPHLAAVVAHALTLLTFSTEHPEFDDRFKKGTPSGSE